MFRVSVLCSREAVVSHHADKKKPRSNASLKLANHEPVYDVDYARIAHPARQIDSSILELDIRRTNT